MREMKTISFDGKRGARKLHIEAPGCIVNITKDLHDSHGREVTSVQVTADQYSDSCWHLPDVFDLRDVARILAELPEPLEPMSADEIEAFLREKLELTRSFNVRVRRIYNANNAEDQARLQAARGVPQTTNRDTHEFSPKNNRCIRCGIDLCDAEQKACED